MTLFLITKYRRNNMTGILQQLLCRWLLTQSECDYHSKKTTLSVNFFPFALEKLTVKIIFILINLYHFSSPVVKTLCEFYLCIELHKHVIARSLMS